MVVTARSSDLVVQEAKTLTLHTNIQLWASQMLIEHYKYFLPDTIQTVTATHLATENSS
jgi:hypothetical protein